ncbi:MAG: hypothetical protein AAB250_16275, partial [Bdellovibrionota bacterium]
MAQPHHVENAVLQTLLISWGSVWLAGAIVTVGCLHYRTSRRTSTLVISLVFAAAAFSDAIEASVLLREAIRHGAMVPSEPFHDISWLRSLSHLTCLLFGIAGFAGIVLKHTKPWVRYLWMAGAGIPGFVVLGIYLGFLSGQLSEIHRSALWTGPNVIYAVSLGVTIGPMWYLVRRLDEEHPMLFHEGLRLALLPLILTEAHQAFMSRNIFDIFAVLSQYEQFLLYGAVFGGLGLDYLQLKRGSWRVADMHEANTRLTEKTHALERANSEAVRASEAKSEFLANMS